MVEVHDLQLADSELDLRAGILAARLFAADIQVSRGKRRKWAVIGRSSIGDHLWPSGYSVCLAARGLNGVECGPTAFD